VGKVCVITGASQGIGRAAAIRMSREADVSTLVLIARNADGLAETGAALDRDGVDVELIPYDLMDLDGIPALVERIHRKYGSIDILLNIAGYADPKSLLDTDVDNIVKTYTINVFAMPLMSRRLCHMYDRPATFSTWRRPPGSPRDRWLGLRLLRRGLPRRRRPTSWVELASRSTASPPGRPPELRQARAGGRTRPGRAVGRWPMSRPIDE
jgi:NAD(P)-dependent dehydrogenase (short-subunit alcohol dehydrogenase family)